MSRRPSHCHPYVGVQYHHFDLYRLADAPSALARLDLAGAFQRGVSLVEWPERLGDLAPPHAVRVRLRHVQGADEAGSEERKIDVQLPQAGIWTVVAQRLREHGPAAGLDVAPDHRAL